ncbi:hypothetical protein RXV86_21790 [Alisedimentitalea sp. MJ-SS2]|uniref:hypothetical protein n=1 Tax=Aliisedimentitalea sp. MJ-SS2 TaxID=3049795 RepID=UPI0029087D2E|nr:hypothetical protein [Alisedimentitalea sp. MJ-SS2]MDU8930027.1 hypothetical protein [Alisedimentitalea sp. MJ-SS2]
MSDFLASHLRNLDTPPGLAVCLGNEAASLLPLCLEIGTEHVVVTEPDPRAAARLRHMTPDNAQVTVIESMITDSTGMAALSTLSLHRFSGLRDVTGLSTLFPSLRETGTTEVATMDVAGLLEQLPGPDSSKPRVLILGPNGEEYPILTALAAQGALQDFDQVFLTLPEIALFQDGATTAELTALLAENGFERAACDTGDPDIPTCHFRLDRKALKQAQVQEGMRRELEQLAAQNTDLQAQLTRLQDDSSVINQAAESAKTENQELRQQLETVRAELEEARTHVKRAQDTTVATRRELAAAQDQATEASTEAETLRQQLEDARVDMKRTQDTTAATRNETETLQQSLSLAIRTQTLRENDLRDLQSQYAALREQAAESDRLIAQLSRHIGQAIEYLPTPRSRSGKATTGKMAAKTTATKKTAPSRGRGTIGPARDG